MLPNGSKVLAWYRGSYPDGTVVHEDGSPESPQAIIIGDFDLPKNVSNALATMDNGEERTVRAPVFQKGEKPKMASYEVHFVRLLSLDALEEERLHGEECACGCHQLREAFSSNHCNRV